MADVSQVDYTSDVGKVRSVIGDTDSANYQLHDEDIQVALDNNSDNIRLAGADLLVRLATKASSGGKVKLLDMEIDNAAASKALLDAAKYLREIAKDDDEQIEVFEINALDDPFAVERLYRRAVFRNYSFLWQ